MTDRQVYTVVALLDRELTDRPELVQFAREDLDRKLGRYVQDNGWDVVRVVMDTVPPDRPEDRFQLRLEATLRPRMDGEWASIRAAIEQDETDRQAARADRHRINDRLDALRDSVAYWGDRELVGRWRVPERPESHVCG